MVETMLAEEELTEVNERLAAATPTEILQWAVERFFPRLTMATAFGPEGCILIHMLSEIGAQVRIFNLDTGYQFPETLALRERIMDRYGIDVELVSAETSAKDYETIHGGPLYVTNSERCCYERKIVPLRRALVGYDSWLTAIRADQSAHRAKASVVGWDSKFNLVKVNPLLRWTRRDVWAFIVANKVPYNPLHDQGYPSIGCWPCTKPVGDGQDERAGAGPARPRPSAACTPWTAVNFECPRTGTGGDLAMKISAKAEYACLAVLALAQRGPGGPPLRIRDISRSHEIPERYLVQILLQLKGAGLVISTRGAAGGYRLARTPAEISLSDVLIAVDGPDPPQRENSKGNLSSGTLARVWEKVRQAERNVLDHTTIAELVAECRPLDWTI